MLEKCYLCCTMKQITTTCLIAFIFLALSACGGSAPQYRIGVSQCAVGLWRDQMNQEIRREAMMHGGVEVMFRTCKDDGDQQIADIEELMAAGVDALIISPTNSHDLVPVIEKAYDRGIPVVLVDRNVESEKYTAFVGADNKEVGRSAANYILQHLPKDAVIVELEGNTGYSPVRDRHEGFVSALTQQGGKAISLDTGWNLNLARSYIDSLFTAGVHPDAIFCHNDFMAEKLSGMYPDLSKHTLLIGVDGLAVEGAQYILDNKISASVEYPTCGILSMRVILSILQGEKVEREYIVSSSVVDKSNASFIQQAYIRAQFLTSEIDTLTGRLNEYLLRFNMQQLLLGTSLLFILILAIMLTALVREYRIVRKLNERLQKVSKARVSFFTNVSHDFRTPLALIADPIRQLRASVVPDSQQFHLLDIASKNVTILMRLINQVLDFRKYEEGKMQLRLLEFNLQQKFQEWAGFFQPLAQNRQFTYTIACPEPIIMVADPEMIERLTYNLLSNAFKYTPKGGTISTSASLSSDGCAVLTFTDSGKGMSEKELSHIFDDFYQASVHYAGTGIGMAVVKAFVEMHHGTVQVESQPEQGTTVRVSLPLRQQGQLAEDWQRSQILDNLQEGAVLAASQPVLDELDYQDVKKDEKPTVLIVDDTADIRSYIRLQLQQQFTIIEAANGQSGLEAAYQQVPDIILLDVMMPGLSGIEVAQRLKQDLRTSHIPILMLTASTSDETQIASFRGGAEAFMQKPFNTQVLQARIDNLLAATAKRQQSLSQSAVATEAPAEGEKEDTEESISPQDKQFVEQLRAYLTAHLSESDLRMDNLGSQLALSYTQLYRKTKSLTGMGPTELLRIIRLERAKEMLLTSNLSVSEITYGVGFTSPSYFTKCYREHYGITPREQREGKKEHVG